MQTLYILDTSDTRIKIIDEKLKAKGELTADILNDTYGDDYKRVYVLSPRFQDNNPEFTGFAVNSTVFFFSLSDKTLDLLAHKNCKVVNITDNERFTCINSKLTAEGALYYAMQKSDLSLKERKVLIIGFGHLGKALLTTFLPHCPHLCVASRRELTRCETRLMGAESCSILSLHDHLHKFDLIINTVPAEIFDRHTQINKNTIILELASKVYPFDYEELKRQNIDFEILKSLPSKTFPVSAANALLDVVIPDFV